MKPQPQLTILLFFIFALQLSAQTVITGRILDHEGAPLAFANVLLLRMPDSLLVRGTLATEAGEYALDAVATGDYRLSVTALGYEPQYSEPFRIETGMLAVDRGTTTMRDVVTLQAVDVVSQKPLFEQKLDRLVVNVENSITAAGGTVLDVLERSPGVTVNRQNNTLTLGGKGGVVVAINGKLNRMPLEAAMQLLQSLNAAQVEKIELYAIPPAGYDAEGDAGMINIVLKKSTDQGVNGSLSFFAGIGRQEKAGGSANLNWRGRRFNFYGDYALNFDDMIQPVEIYRKVSLPGKLIRTFSDNHRDPYRLDYNGRLGLDYEIGPRTTIGALLSGYSNKWTMDAFTRNLVWENDILQSRVTLTFDEVNHWRHGMGNAYLRHAFRDGSTLSLDVDYLCIFR